MMTMMMMKWRRGEGQYKASNWLGGRPFNGPPGRSYYGLYAYYYCVIVIIVIIDYDDDNCKLNVLSSGAFDVA